VQLQTARALPNTIVSLTNNDDQIVMTETQTSSGQQQVTSYAADALNNAMINDAVTSWVRISFIMRIFDRSSGSVSVFLVDILCTDYRRSVSIVCIIMAVDLTTDRTAVDLTLDLPDSVYFDKGNSFSFLVSITPRPGLSPTELEPTLFSGDSEIDISISSNISLASNLATFNVNMLLCDFNQPIAG